MKKCISLILAFVFVIGICASVPMTITANALVSSSGGTSDSEVEKFATAEARVKLVENYHGETVEIYDEDGMEKIGEYFKYDLFDTKPRINVHYNYGSSTISGSYWEFDDVSIEIEQSNEKPLTVGVHTATLKLTYDGVQYECDYVFEIIENPVKSISAVPSNALIYGFNCIKETESYYDDMDETQVEYSYWDFNAWDTNPIITVTYKDGNVYTGTSKEIEAATGYGGFYISQESDGSTGKEKAYIGFLGKECAYNFEIIENPVKSVIAVPSKSFTEYVDSEYVRDRNYDYDEEKYYEKYEIDDLTYDITLNYKDGTSKIFNGIKNEDKIEGYTFNITFEQSYDNPLKVGKNKVNATYIDLEIETYIEVLESPVKSISIEVDGDLMEHRHSDVREYTDPITNETKQYSHYNFHHMDYNLKVNYKDGTTKTFENVGLNFSQADGEIVEIESTQSEKTPFGFGLNKATAKYMGATCEFSFNIVENPYTKIEISGENELNVVLTKKDGSKEFVKVEECERDNRRSGGGAGGLFIGVNVYANNIKYPLVFGSINEWTEDGMVSLGYRIEMDHLTSNLLDENSILELGAGVSNAFISDLICYSLVDILDYKDGTVTTGNVDTLILLAVEQDFELRDKYIVYSNEKQYLKVPLEEAKEIVESTFNINDFDFKKSPSYKSTTNTIEFQLPETIDNDKFEISDKFSIKNSNNKIIYSTSYVLGSKNNKINIVYNSDLKIDSIYFGDLPIHTHSYTSKVTKQPTCTETGVKTFTCSCGDSYTETIKAKGHTTSVINKKDATCTVDGYTGDTYCSVCKTTTVKGKAIAKLGHSYNAGEITTKATCEKDGVKTFTCTRCKATKTETIKAAGHKEVVIPAVAPTYTTVGKTEGKKCSVCGTITVAQKDVAKLTLATPVVTVKNSATGVKVTWGAIDGAESYKVYRKTYSTKTKKYGSWKTCGTVTTTSYVDTKAKSGTKYVYTVKALNNDTNSDIKNSSSILFLSQPTVKIANNASGVKVSWNKITGATGYTIYRSVYSGGKWSGWNKMGTLKSTKTSWTDKSVKSGVKYKYTVKAVNGKTASTYKSSSSLLYLAQPKVAVRALSNGIKVAWVQSTGATSYKIYRSEYNTKTKKWSSWKGIKTAKSTSKSYVDKTAKKGVKYRYTVKAVNGKTASAYKSSASVKR